VGPGGYIQDPYSNQQRNAQIRMWSSQPPTMGGIPGFSNSMRTDATGALIPNGLNRDMMGTSMRSMHSAANNNFATLANNQYYAGQTGPLVGQNFQTANLNNLNNDFAMMTNSQRHTAQQVPQINNFGMGNSMREGRVPVDVQISTHSRNFRADSTKERKSGSCGSTISSDDGSFAEESCAVSKQRSAPSQHQTDSGQQIREEFERELLRKEREAKMLRFEQRVSSRKLQSLEENQEETKSKLKKAKKKAKKLEEEANNTIAVIAAEKEGVTHELEELEDENEDMMIRIAELEDENLRHKEKKKKKRSKSAERKLMSEMHDIDEARPTIRRWRSAKGPLMTRGMEQTSTSKTKRSKSAERKLCLPDDDDQKAIYRRGRALERSRYSDYRDSSSSSESAVDVDSTSKRKKKQKKKRSKSAERKLEGLDFDDDSAIYDMSLDERSRHSDGKKKKKRSKSTERKLGLVEDDKNDRSLARSSRHSDDSNKKKRSKSAERKLNAESYDIFERPRVRASRSYDDQLLELQKHVRRSHAREEELVHFDRRMMIKRATSERVLQSKDYGIGRSSHHRKKPNKLARMKEEQEEVRESHVRGMARSESLLERKKKDKKSSSTDKLKVPKRSLSGEKLTQVDRHY
jgi:hypothetical protein